ncbi:MAG: UDP-N-acetylmuramate--L-alanine ligase [Chloroflexota bacterium]
MEDIDLNRKRHIHFTGIGGAGMSPLAVIALEMGHRVTGSDLQLSPATDRLAARGTVVFQGHHARNVAGAELVVVTSAAKGDNPEVVAARAQGVPVLKAAQFLSRLMAGKRGIAVAGTHGKTTTTGLIAFMLARAGLDPSFVVGGGMRDLGVGGHLGYGDYFVAEADEYDARFLELRPWMAVVTSIEPDHLDYYGTFERLVQAFASFVALVPAGGAIVACLDDPQVARLWAGRQGDAVNWVTYGFHPAADWRAEKLAMNGLGGIDFVARRRNRIQGRFSTAIPGRHNALNALAAVAVARELDLDMKTIKGSLRDYHGIERRFELVGQAGGVTIMDDYAHHPSEVRATLAAARERFGPARLWAVFQPHTFTRTIYLFNEFTQAFAQADRVVVTDIYAARENENPGISSQDLVRAMHHPATSYIGSLSDCALALAREVRGGDVVLTLGAGDVWQVGRMLYKSLHQGGAGPPDPQRLRGEEAR